MSGKSTKFDHTNASEVMDLKECGHMSDGSDSPPMLSAAVMHALAGFSEKKEYWTSGEKAGDWCDLSDPKVYEDNVQILLKHLYERLDIGLGEAWESSFGYDGEMEDTLEEGWARIFSEMFVFAAYGGVADSYRTKRDDSGRWDMEYVVLLDSTQKDPSYPIVAACQHITNYGIITRGISSTELGASGTTAGAGTASCPCFSSAKGGSWKVTSTGPLLEDSQFRQGSVLHEKLGITPGSVVAFNADGPNATKQATVHIACFLRVWGSNQFQAIDTGPLGVGGTDSGTEDHDGTTVVNSNALPHMMVGVGTLRKVEPSKAQADFLATARPLGFAQLVFADESNIIRYISRALPMHHGRKGFAITRYVWSLRCLPANGKAFWILMYPGVGDFSRLLRAEGSRDLTVSELVARIPPQGQGKTVVPDKRGKLFTLSHVLVSTKGYSGFTLDEGDKDLGWSKPYKDQFGTHPSQWQGLAEGTRVYRRKKHGNFDEWANGTVSEPVLGASPFPKELRELRFADNPHMKLYDFWSAMSVDQEYTCVDPTDRDNPQLKDVATELTYFDGTLAASPPAAAEQAS